MRFPQVAAVGLASLTMSTALAEEAEFCIIVTTEDGDTVEHCFTYDPDAPDDTTDPGDSGGTGGSGDSGGSGGTGGSGGSGGPILSTYSDVIDGLISNSHLYEHCLGDLAPGTFMLQVNTVLVNDGLIPSYTFTQPVVFQGDFHQGAMECMESSFTGLEFHMSLLPELQNTFKAIKR